MYKWEEARENCQECHVDAVFQAYVDELCQMVRAIQQTVTPENFISCVGKIHSVEQKSQLVLFHLHSPTTYKELTVSEWIGLIEEEYFDLFLDKFNFFSPNIKSSMLYQIEGKQEEKIVTFVWEKDLETEMVVKFNESREALRQDYSRVIDDFCRIKRKIHQLIRNVTPDNFFTTYDAVRRLDIQCVYYFDSIDFLRMMSVRQYFQLMKEDFPRYKRDLYQELDVNSRLEVPLFFDEI